MNYRTILFDFDGTFADTADISLSILNSLAPEFGFDPSTPEELPALRQLSARELLTRRLGIPLWDVRRIRRLERRMREELLKYSDDVRIYAGMPELFHALHAKGHRLGIVTSKSRLIVDAALTRSGTIVDFVHAGSGYFGKRKALKDVMRQQKIHREQTIYVGDELRDVEACRKVGIDILAVAWGFNAPEALRAAGAPVAATPAELSAMLTGTQ